MGIEFRDLAAVAALPDWEWETGDWNVSHLSG
jgi:hypothetical protein